MAFLANFMFNNNSRSDYQAPIKESNNNNIKSNKHKPKLLINKTYHKNNSDRFEPVEALFTIGHYNFIRAGDIRRRNHIKNNQLHKREKQSHESFFSFVTEDSKELLSYGSDAVANRGETIYNYCEFPTGHIYKGTIEELRKILNVYYNDKIRNELICNGKIFAPRPNEVDEALKDIAQQACYDLILLANESSCNWELYSNKNGLVIQVKSIKTNKYRKCGRAIYEFELPEHINLTMEFLSNFLWQEETKMLYDSYTDCMLCFFEIDRDTNVTSQIFKSKYGVSGREFNLVLRRMTEEDDKFERLVIGTKSVPKMYDVEQYIDRIEVKQLFNEKKIKTVRGEVFTAGFYIEHEKSTSIWKIIYINDVDANVKNIPNWIVNKSKIDQLKSLAELVNVLYQYWNDKGGIIENNLYEGEYALKK